MRSTGQVVTDVLFRNWGMKIAAFIMAAILFVFTRDDVTRTFNVPLRPVPDPDRVLLSRLPDAVQVQVRGPWTRVNRLQAPDFGTAAIDLRSLRPGPLEIDRGAIVMPPGVFLSRVDYDPVDLRFEPVIERDVAVVVATVGAPAPDFRLVGVEAEPARWRVRGGRTVVQRLGELSTEAFDLSGRTADLQASLALVRPEGLHFAQVADGEVPKVQVTASIEPIVDTRTFEVSVDVPLGLDPTGAIDRRLRVGVSGPRVRLRELAEGGKMPLVAEATRDASKDRPVAVVRIRWTEAVPLSVRTELTMEPRELRVDLPPPPAPPPEPDLDRDRDK